jgi:predicted PurR-regulated permease PerM
MKEQTQTGVLAGASAIAATCLTLVVFQKILWLVVPTILALVIYFCLRPLVRVLVGLGVRHRVAARLVAGLVMGLPILLGILFLPWAALHWEGWRHGMAHYVQGGLDFLQATETWLAGKLPFLKNSALLSSESVNLEALGKKAADQYLGAFLLQLAHWLPAVLLSLYLAFFLLNEGNTFKKYLIRSVPNAYFERTLLLVGRVNESLQVFFVGLMQLTMIEAACLGGGLWLIGISSPVLLGLVAAMMAWVPYIGSAAGCLLIVLAAAADFPGRPGLVYSCLALCLCVRALDDFVFVPMTIGRSLHVHPVLSVLLLFAGGMLAGPVGLVLVLPLYGVVKIITETASQIITDKNLRARFREERALHGRM